MPCQNCSLENYTLYHEKHKKLPARPGALEISERVIGLVHDPLADDGKVILDIFYPRKEGMPKIYPALPYEPFEATVVLVQHEIYVVGGTLKDGGEAKQAVIKLDLNQADRMEWEFVAPLNVPRMAHASAAIIGGIFTSGGMNIDYISLKKAEVYTQLANDWREVADMQYARSHFGIVQGPRGRVYAFGGFDEHGRSLDQCEMYSFATNQWTELAQMNFPRAGHAVVAVGNQVFIIGGQADDVLYIGAVLEFDLSTLEWRRQHSVLNKPRALMSACVIQKSLFVIGGQHHDQDFNSSLIEYFDKTSRQWIEIDSMEEFIELNSVCVIR